jgi:small subunit ribosomal protein S16
MAVTLRMSRFGNRNRPFYRVNAIDKRRQRDGRVIEQLGFYNPLEKDEAKQLDLQLDRIAYWLSVGAQPSDTVAALIRRKGLKAVPGTKVQEQALPKA